MSETRMPVQKRSVEKRERIVRNGFELMCNNGYFNTTTSDIAKYVGVSTGIIYQYFNDKKEIFIEGFSKYSDDIMFPILDILKNNTIKLDNMEKLLNEMLNVFIEKHTLLKREHEEMLALAHLDEDIDKIFYGKMKDFHDTDVIINNGYKINESAIRIIFYDNTVATYGKEWHIEFRTF